MPAALNYFNSNQQYQHHNKCISRSNSHAKTIKEHEQQHQHPQAKISLDLCSISDHMSGYNHRNNEFVPYAAAAKDVHQQNGEPCSFLKSPLEMQNIGAGVVLTPLGHESNF